MTEIPDKIESAFRKLYEKLALVEIDKIVDRHALAEEIRLLRLKEFGIMDEDPIEHTVENLCPTLFRYCSKVHDCFKKENHV